MGLFLFLELRYCKLNFKVYTNGLFSFIEVLILL